MHHKIITHVDEIKTLHDYELREYLEATVIALSFAKAEIEELRRERDATNTKRKKKQGPASRIVLTPRDRHYAE